MTKRVIRTAILSLTLTTFASKAPLRAQTPSTPRPPGAEGRLLDIEKDFPGFAGFWFDSDGSVHVATGNLRDSARLKVVVAHELDRRGNRRAEIVNRRFVFHQSKYGFAELWDYQCRVGKAAVDSVPGYQSAGIRYQVNQVRFGVVDPKGIPALKRVVSSLGIPEDAVSVEMEDRACLAIAKSGIVISPKDSITGESLMAGTHLFAREGDFVDSVTVRSTVSPRLTFFPLTIERPGTYEIGVDRAGYKPWRMRNVRVERDACNVITVNVTALLVRK